MTERDPFEPKPLEIDVQPTVPGRIARALQRVRTLGRAIEGARTEHASVDFTLSVIERDSRIGGGILAGALAYRLFVFLLPLAVLFVSGLGLYSGAVDRSPTEIAKEAGLTGLIASEVSSAASDQSRWLVFLVMIPVALYALTVLYRAIAIVHAIAWHGSGRGVRIQPAGVAALGGAVIVYLVALELSTVLRRRDELGGLAALAAYTLLVGGAWLVVSHCLPRGDVGWRMLVPGAIVVAVGMLFVNAFNVYVTTRLVEGRSGTYGALGIATALLLSLVLVGRLFVLSAGVNATVAERATS